MQAEDFLQRVQAGTVTLPFITGADRRWTRLCTRPPSESDLRERFRGALVGGAIGDTLGRPNEGRHTEVARERKVREYRPWHGWTGEPKGTITDDTQMKMWVAESILGSAEREKGIAESNARNQLLEEPLEPVLCAQCCFLMRQF